jgi:hypothetical protein
VLFGDLAVAKLFQGRLIDYLFVVILGISSWACAVAAKAVFDRATSESPAA